MMYRIKNLPILLFYLLHFSIINRSPGILIVTLLMLALSAVIIVAQFSAPFIYTLF